MGHAASTKKNTSASPSYSVSACLPFIISARPLTQYRRLLGFALALVAVVHVVIYTMVERCKLTLASLKATGFNL